MLGKLFRHEWRGTYKIGCLMLILVAGVTFFGWLAFQSPMWQSLSNEDYSYVGFSSLDFMSIMTLMMYVVMLFGTTYGIVIYIGVHFYKTMYTDEGYLTHTLPVTKHKLLISKVLVGGLWFLLVVLAVWLSVMVLCISLIGMTIRDYTVWDIWREITENWDEIVETLDSAGLRLGRWFGLTSVSMLISPFCSVAILFGAISLGQLFTKHRVLMAIVSYIGITVLIGILNSIIQSANSVRMMGQMMSDTLALDRYVSSNGLFSLLENIVLAVILYFVSFFIIDRKLNME